MQNELLQFVIYGATQNSSYVIELQSHFYYSDNSKQISGVEQRREQVSTK